MIALQSNTMDARIVHVHEAVEQKKKLESQSEYILIDLCICTRIVHGNLRDISQSSPVSNTC